MISTKGSRAAFWQQHREAYLASGLSRSAYCREHGLKVHQLSYQIGLASKSTGVSGKSAFARVVSAAPATVGTRGTARLVFSTGVALELDSGADPAWIAQVIAQVGGGR